MFFGIAMFVSPDSRVYFDSKGKRSSLFGWSSCRTTWNMGLGPLIAHKRQPNQNQTWASHRGMAFCETTASDKIETVDYLKSHSLMLPNGHFSL